MIPKGEMCCQMAENCLEFAKDRELKIQRRFEKTHELFATKIESTFEAVIAHSMSKLMPPNLKNY